MKTSSKTFLFATHNPAKVARFTNVLKEQNIELVTVDFFKLKINDPEENGQNEWENALIKAKSYWQALLENNKLSQIDGVVSLDTGVYFEGVPENLQPGKNVQRIAKAGGAEESDDERFEKMAKFYQDLAKNYNSALPGYFLDVFCLKNKDGEFEVKAKRSFILTSTMYQKDVHFPLSSFYTVNGLPYHSLSQNQMSDFIKPSVDALISLLSNSN